MSCNEKDSYFITKEVVKKRRNTMIIKCEI